MLEVNEKKKMKNWLNYQIKHTGDWFLFVYKFFFNLTFENHIFPYKSD